jgi:hypothetical protein
MFGRATAVAATAALTLALGAASAGAAPIVPSTAADVDYHTEGLNDRGGSIGIHTDRAPNFGTAVAVCDPDPSAVPHQRPDDCGFAEPAGTGKDLVGFSPQISDADESPNNAFTPSTDLKTREILNGTAGFDTNAPKFQGLFFGDEDMHFRLIPRTLDAYLAPNGDPNNRWRRFCGTGLVDQFDNSGPGGAPAHPPLPPFDNPPGQVRKFIVEVWDPDFRDPTKGQQDYYVIDILKPTSTFDISTCQETPLVPVVPPPPPPPPPPGGPGVPPPVVVVVGPNPRVPAVPPVAPTEIAGSLPPLVTPSAVSAAKVFVSAAGARGPGGCVQRSFKAAVRGSRIVRVDFSLDGHVMKRVTHRDGSGMFRATIGLAGLTRTTHHITARVLFMPNTSPRRRTLPIAFRRCAQAASAPAFTG